MDNAEQIGAPDCSSISIGESRVEVPLLLCFRSPVYCWRRCKRLCHPHSWNVMHAVHRVCFKREAEGEEERWGGEGKVALFSRNRVHRGSMLKVGSTTTTS